MLNDEFAASIGAMSGRVWRSRSTWSALMKAGDAGTLEVVLASSSTALDFCLFGKVFFLFFAEGG